MVNSILLAFGCILTFFGKAVSDVVDNEPIWKTSVFSKFKIDGFFGSKEYTWVRKDRKNFLLNYLFHTILVFVTDIWHFGNFMRNIGIYLSLFACLLIGTTQMNVFGFIWVVVGYAFLNVVGFHLSYHWILRKG